MWALSLLHLLLAPGACRQLQQGSRAVSTISSGAELVDRLRAGFELDQGAELLLPPALSLAGVDVVPGNATINRGGGPGRAAN